MEQALKALAEELGCTCAVLHAPSVSAECVVPPLSPKEASRIDSLTRHVLWPMARKGGEPQILNRARLKRGAPVLPYRIALAPVMLDGRAVGVIAALRNHSQPSFEPSAAAALTAAVAKIQRSLSAGVGQTGIQRRPDLRMEVAQHLKNHDVLSVVYADLDQLHAINEVSGFAAGDDVIRAVDRTWQSLVQPGSGVASRLSGDRYAAVLFNQELGQAKQWAERAREAIAALEFRGRRSRITASVGVACLPQTGEFDHALAAAETACRAAKDRGRNRVEVYESADVSMMRRHEEVHESRIILDALEGDRFVLHAQPIVALGSTASPTHYEVLLRLPSLDGPSLSIGDYLKAAERYQLLERIDRWVIDHALAILAPRAKALGELGMRFAINVTGPSLSEPQFAEFVASELAKRGVPGSLLAFEFTETAAVRNLRATQGFVAKMQEIGSRIALDDFGTGLSSLIHLKELAVNQIKIDGQFVGDILTDARSEALVRALAQIAEQLGLETVAEFVESAAVAAQLRKLGVRYGQGHLFGRSQPLEDTLAEVLARRWARPAAVGG